MTFLSTYACYFVVLYFGDISFLPVLPDLDFYPGNFVRKRYYVQSPDYIYFMNHLILISLTNQDFSILSVLQFLSLINTLSLSGVHGPQCSLKLFLFSIHLTDHSDSYISLNTSLPHKPKSFKGLQPLLQFFLRQVSSCVVLNTLELAL